MEAEMRPSLRSILVPTDFSASSDRAIEYASTLASGFGATVHLIHVLDPVSLQLPWETPIESAARHERSYQESRAKLAVVAATLDRPRLPVTCEVRSGTPAIEIALAAVDYGADLIVMATHGRSGLPHLLLGSVAEHVIRHATCPVLAVRDQMALGVPLTGHAAVERSVGARIA
jgi:universal stress protein A